MGAHTDLEAATGLWSRLARPFVLVDVVDALLGLSTEVVQQLAGVTVAVCDEAADLLEQTLDEEKATDEKLTEIAESAVNASAAEAPEAGD